MNGEAEVRRVLATHAAAVEAFVACAREVPESAWADPRETGKWTPCQEVLHLILTYREYGAEIADGPAVTAESFPARTPELREVILPRILAGGWFPSGAKSPKLARPDDAIREKDAALSELHERSKEFANAVMAATLSHPDRHVRHPYFGALGLTDLVIVLTEHTHHHRRHLPAQDRLSGADGSS